MKQAKERLRGAAHRVVEAFLLGLSSRHKAVKGSGDQVVELPDLSLAVQTADKVSQCIPELMPHKSIDVNLDASNRLVELMRKLDEREEADRGGVLPPPPEPAVVRSDELVDPHEA